jgi:hypothetical protein
VNIKNDIEEGFSSFEENRQRAVDETFLLTNPNLIGDHLVKRNFPTEITQVTLVSLSGTRKPRITLPITGPFDYEEGCIYLSDRGQSRSLRWESYGSIIDLVDLYEG